MTEGEKKRNKDRKRKLTGAKAARKGKWRIDERR